MNLFLKGYYYGYSFFRISYLYIIRLIYKDYTEERKSIKGKNVDYMNNVYALFGDCDHIIDNIYLGSCYNASNINLLNELEIKKIVNISYDVPNYHENIEYYNYKIKDDGIDDLDLDILDKIIEFVKENDNKILVHCVMGKSRSASFIIYYLMKIHNLKLEDALDKLNEKRNVINPSIKFYNKLKEYNNYLKDSI